MWMKIVQYVCATVTIAVPVAGTFWWKFSVDRPDAEHGLKLTKAGRVAMPGLILATVVSTVLGWVDAHASDVEKEEQQAENKAQRDVLADLAKHARGCSNIPEEVAARVMTVLGDGLNVDATVAVASPQPSQALNTDCSATAPPFHRGAAQARLAVSNTEEEATIRLRTLRDLLAKNGGSEWNKWLDDVKGWDGDKEVVVIVVNQVQPQAIEVMCDWLTRCQGWNPASRFKCEVRSHGY